MLALLIKNEVLRVSKILAEHCWGDLDKSTMLAVIGSYFFHAGLLGGASFVAVKWNGLELWSTLCSLAWLAISIACIVSGFRLMKMVESDGTDHTS